MTASGSFRFWERSMFVFVFANLLVVPLFFMAHPRIGDIAEHFVIPGIRGGANSTSILLIIGMVGTTVAPWQLFFQQSNIIDKRITPRWINYERLDTWIGAIVVVVGAAALISVSAFAFGQTRYFGHFSDAGETATALDHVLDPDRHVVDRGDDEAAQVAALFTDFFQLILGVRGEEIHFAGEEADVVGAEQIDTGVPLSVGHQFGGGGEMARRFDPLLVQNQHE